MSQMSGFILMVVLFALGALNGIFIVQPIRAKILGVHNGVLWDISTMIVGIVLAVIEFILVLAVLNYIEIWRGRRQ